MTVPRPLCTFTHATIGKFGSTLKIFSRELLLYSSLGWAGLVKNQFEVQSPTFLHSLGQPIKGTGIMVQGSGIPLQGNPFPSLFCTCFDQQILRWGCGKVEPGALAQDPLCSVGLEPLTHRVGSESCVKEPFNGSFQPTFSIVSLTSRCMQATHSLTSLYDEERHQPLYPEGKHWTQGFTGLKGFYSIWLSQ